MIEIKQDLPDEDNVRLQTVRPCKIYEPRLDRYFLGTTSDIADSSILLTIPRPLELHENDELFLGVAQKRRQVLIQSQDMVRVRVIRSVRTTEGTTAVAVELCDPLLSNAVRLRRAA